MNNYQKVDKILKQLIKINEKEDNKQTFNKFLV